MASAYEMRKFLSGDPALKQTMTEVALIATAAGPCMLLERATYDKLSSPGKAVVDEYPDNGELSSLENFFETLFEIGILDHDDSTPTPSNPISVGILGEFLVDDYFNNHLEPNS